MEFAHGVVVGHTGNVVADGTPHAVKAQLGLEILRMKSYMTRLVILDRSLID